MTTNPAPVATELPLQIVERQGASVPAEAARKRFGLQGHFATALTLAGVVFGGVLLVLGLGWLGTRTTGAAPLEAAPAVVVALGRLEPLGETRSLAVPFGAADARVAAIQVSEGQYVKAGSTLVVFDNASALMAALRVAEEQFASRQAALAQAERSVSSSQAESAASLARASVAVRAAEAEYQRWSALAEQGFASPAAVDQRRALRDEAAEEQRRAQAVVGRHAGDGAAQPDLLAARLSLAVASAERDRAAQELSRSVVVAPFDGTVIEIHARPGERPGAGGILEFGDTRSMTAELELYQSDVARIHPGQPVRLRSPAFPDDLVGRIDRVGLSVGRQQRIDTSPAANLDARVVKARVVLDAASSSQAQTLIGLEVKAYIETQLP